MTRRVIIGIIALVLVCGVGYAALPKLVSGDFYLERLDTWVSRGGNVSDVQSKVVENCGKLVMASASIFDNLRFMTYGRDDFDFRTDVCTKMTVNRVYQQPEFQKEKIVSTICDSQDDLFRQLCRRSGLRPN